MLCKVLKKSRNKPNMIVVTRNEPTKKLISAIRVLEQWGTKKRQEKKMVDRNCYEMDTKKPEMN